MPHLTDVMDWVFIEQIGTDIDRLMDTEDELNLPFSYFPYHVDLGLVIKSAYSASANPHFFEWVHLIGALVRSPRSMNAKHITDSLMLDLIANAACVAFAFSGNFSFKKVYTETGEEEVLPADEDEDEPSEADMNEEILKSRDPTKWCMLLQSCQGNLPQKVKLFINRAVKQIDDPREGTIDQHLKATATTITSA
ncbi:unnamed protein product [Chrysodeixis includens]|uniref:Rhabdovirus nucleocapsid domain-containing protein n=1 Tax=Chrysodeixis includens TaxID=689277 RepID=A0A9N8KR52_CHRIL|nr:unnamed protein product [Chrysodeixis includens]